MKIKGSEHVFVAGQTGSGKTYLVEKFLLYPEKTVIALDIKTDMTYNSDIIVNSLSELMDIDFNESETPLKIIYRPALHELNEESYNEFFKFCYNLKNCTVWIDEVAAVCKNAFSLPFYYASILMRGRSRNTNCFSVSQRPRQIPLTILSESIHYFIFRLNMLEDRKRLYEATGQKDFLNNPDKEFEFYYYNNKYNIFKRGIMI